ncbi:hypothetical protein HM1_2668 [Heliomicrobium modesticaldum Ice1]|uniref:Uncharacterized protein n=1 Tax=Heliobacterium modesticaldum (strain ATCC 51547 / Ice1) TaxID=498761 RepID=B0TBI4_HELMI|nr:hypothetical protein HM1_2668 [Heliomicrobium modesticaldum Ice1]
MSLKGQRLQNNTNPSTAHLWRSLEGRRCRYGEKAKTER